MFPIVVSRRPIKSRHLINDATEEKRIVAWMPDRSRRALS